MPHNVNQPLFSATTRRWEILDALSTFPSFIFAIISNVLLLREQHQTEVSAMEDKVKRLELELEKSKKSSDESTEQFQTKVGTLLSCFSAVLVT